MRKNRHSAIGAMTVALLAFAQPGMAGADEAITSIPATQLDWARTEEGVAFASLVGDRFVEPYMAMVQLPAGLVSPPHVKTANMFGVVISGTMTHSAVGADPSSETLLHEGSFYKVPAGLAHVSRCVSETDCVTFLYQDGEFDFLPVAQ
jgi:quercetin dioxygenase-like cupin family protein